jgi:hypothetical protein
MTFLCCLSLSKNRNRAGLNSLFHFYFVVKVSSFNSQEPCLFDCFTILRVCLCIFHCMVAAMYPIGNRVSEWVSEWVSACVRACVRASVRPSVSEWVSDIMSIYSSVSNHIASNSVIQSTFKPTCRLLTATDCLN